MFSLLIVYLISFKNAFTALYAVAMASPEPHFIRFQSWWAKIDPAAKSL